MRRGLRIILAVSSLSLYGFAQVPSLKEGPPFQPKASMQPEFSAQSHTSRQPPIPPGQWREVIQNQGSSSLEAQVAFFRCGSSEAYFTYNDSLILYGSESVAPTGSLEVQAGDPSQCSGGVDGAIFSDGHVEGKLEALDLLYKRRQGAYAALVDAIQSLNGVVLKHNSLQDVIDTLYSQSEKTKATHTERTYGYQTVYLMLKHFSQHDGGNLSVPSDHSAHPAPKAEDLVREMGYSHDQARAAVLVVKLKEWRSALEGHLDIPSKPQ
jgi:hypothetical protein